MVNPHFWTWMHSFRCYEVLDFDFMSFRWNDPDDDPDDRTSRMESYMLKYRPTYRQLKWDRIFDTWGSL
jgi:hypothetical protein